MCTYTYKGYVGDLLVVTFLELLYAKKLLGFRLQYVSNYRRVPLGDRYEYAVFTSILFRETNG